MKVTGTLIKNEIKMINTELSSLNNIFSESLVYFPDETQPNIPELGQKILALEKRLGIWQAAQKQFNLRVTFQFSGRQITLQEGVSIVGGYGRVSKLFKVAAGSEKKDRYSRGYRQTTRASNETLAKDSITKEQALAEYKKIESDANVLRSWIGKANNTEVDLEWLDTVLSTE